MPCIGIIANPASGKDIRRLVSYATTIDNQEKVNIVKRIVMAAQALGVDEFLFMRDTFQIGYKVMDDLTRSGELSAECHVLDMPMTATSDDSTLAAALMARAGAGCAAVLGGDGTCRAAAKGIGSLPLLPISTGTNNVYPSMIEGTVAGMAAAAIARMDDPDTCCVRDKRIEIAINGSYVDLALVDAVITDDLYIGSRAIWDMDRIHHMLVTRCHPASIGFSSVAGCLEIVRDTDDWGLSLAFGEGGTPILAPIAAGVLTQLHVSQSERLAVDTPYIQPVERNGMIALDGEREQKLRKGDTLTYTITRNGPRRVLVHKALEMAVQRGLFRPACGGEA